MTIVVVSNLFNGQVLAVHNQCHQCERLAQGKAGVEQFRSIFVSGLSWHTRCQFQVAHCYHTVAKQNKSLVVGSSPF